MMKGTCSPIVQQIELTEEIKQIVLDVRIYRPIPASVQKPTIQQITHVELLNSIENQASSVSLKVIAVCEYIYLVYVREFKIRGETVYKLGRSTQENLSRYKQYPKGSLLLLLLACKDCVNVERSLIDKFKNKYTQCTEYGTEYFNGDSDEMIRDVFKEIMPE